MENVKKIRAAIYLRMGNPETGDNARGAQENQLEEDMEEKEEAMAGLKRCNIRKAIAWER